MTENEKAIIDAKDEKDAKDNANKADKDAVNARLDKDASNNPTEWTPGAGPLNGPGEHPVIGDETVAGTVKTGRQYERECMDLKADQEMADEQERAAADAFTRRHLVDGRTVAPRHNTTDTVLNPDAARTPDGPAGRNPDGTVRNPVVLNPDGTVKK